MKRKTGFFFDENCFWHSTGMHVMTLPVGGWVQPSSGTAHAESPETKRRLKNLMDVSGLSHSLHLSSASPIDEQTLRKIHPEEYLKQFKRVSDNGGGMLGIEASLGPGSYEIAKLSASLACAAVEAVLSGELDNAYSLSRPPGHHCLPDKPMGFCFLANIPLAIEQAKARFDLKRVAVIDWDVHHGNGTQHIYWDRSDVLTISIHQDGCFPPGYSGEDDIGEGEGTGYNLNIPLLAGAGHNSYIYAMTQIVLPALERFKPELIIVACGYDANAMDPLARMQLHSESFREMTQLVQQAADSLCDGKLVVVHEGGYAESYVPFCGLAVLEQMSGIRTEVKDPMLDSIRLQQPRAEFELFQQQQLDKLKEKFGL
ncbi:MULTISPECIES: class II histone deacetylase [Photorhabdus]|uniref:class II histone deacetylase n=1 Tax=Photorhabdus TaxID=29487 RepID=UPI000DCED817|nr:MULTISPECIES: class II histone deacetylase [Photorhabdus]AXG42980.1 class II histone deacetylase [Photorhabdus laumondii subsp. laumondii]NDL14662.1 class II histone deacetylase [Photorhabdus laumondii subsp. laumondii]NDL46464.1 class II histone deacetylase [Photorhabdus laumondii subsp. laumondii]NDL51123.1 class II histone deacetylase [Photorhabdus laumondii subsp. laumondii]RAW89441.1 class II histone deacetylase [Photorhabdus sp. S5P8-50]